MRTIFLGLAFVGHALFANGFPKIEYTEGGLALREWLVLGPILAFDTQRYTGPDDRKEWLGPELFKKHGEPDEYADKERFLAILGTSGDGTDINGLLAPRIERTKGRDIIDFFDLFARPYTSDNPQTSCYSACVVRCEGATTAYLLTASTGGLRIWLNGQPVHTKGMPRRLETFSEANRLDLQAGENFLVIKVRANASHWGMAARLEPSAIAATQCALDAQKTTESHLLWSSVIAEGETPILAIRGAPSLQDFAVEIADLDGNVCLRTRSHNGRVEAANKLTTGLYRLSIEIEGKRFHESFCVGSPVEFEGKAQLRFSRLRSDEKAASNFSAHARRMERLLQPPSVPRDWPQQRDWERKVLFSLAQYHEWLTKMESNLDPFRGATGFSLRGFQSSIDGQTQYYRLFIPSTYRESKRKLPLVIVLPTPVTTPRAFIDSPHIAAHGEALRLTRAAEQQGLGLLWPGYRNQPAGHPCEFAHLEEVLASVGRDYEIDSQRIFLLGVCEAGMVGTMAALHWPQRFAGIGLLHPVFSKQVNDPSEPSAFRKLAAYQSWLRHSNPVESFVTLKDLPVYLIHEGSAPKHGDFRFSLMFKKACEAAGFPLRFERSYQTVNSSEGAIETLLAWFATLRRETASNRRRSHPYVEGAISAALAEPFIVVIGSQGSKAEQDATARLADEFQKAWQVTHFGNCRMLRDTELVGDLGDKNLVLIGNQRVNRVWSQKSARMEVQVSPSALCVREKVWQGASLCFQAIVTDPDRPNRKLILVGGNNVATAKFETLRLSVDGWYQYAIWDSKEARLLDAGYFEMPPDTLMKGGASHAGN